MNLSRISMFLPWARRVLLIIHGHHSLPRRVLQPLGLALSRDGTDALRAINTATALTLVHCSRPGPQYHLHYAQPRPVAHDFQHSCGLRCQHLQFLLLMPALAHARVQADTVCGEVPETLGDKLKLTSRKTDEEKDALLLSHDSVADHVANEYGIYWPLKPPAS